MTELEPTRVVAVLPVRDLGRAVAWYQGVGFEVVTRYDAHGYALLALDGSELHLTVNPDVDPARSQSGCYLRVGDVDEVHARWTAAGAPEIAPLVDQFYGVREFATEDPDGNLWRVGTHIRPTAPAAEGDPTDVDEAAGAAVDAIPHDGSAGTTDADWLAIVAGGTCAGCGFTASEQARSALGGLIVDEADRLGRLITVADDVAVRTRPRPDQWSAMEYGAHVRDALAVLTERVVRTLRDDEPDLGWWDQDAAIENGWANDEEAASVADDVARNASHLRDALAGLTDAEWDRAATRRGERFTVDLLARYALHEVVHHQVDVASAIAGG